MKLCYESITGDLQYVLLNLMRQPQLDEFRLVGGTALALYMGHRRSIDIDLFSDRVFDAGMISDLLLSKLNVYDASVSENSLSCFINDVKVDIIAHRYPWLEDAIEVDGIRIASIFDILAMKLNAVANRGCKKDFWDIAVLLDKFSLDEMLNIFSKRYPHINNWQVVKSLTYFDDAEGDPDPVILDNRDWLKVKSAIMTSCRGFL